MNDARRPRAGQAAFVTTRPAAVRGLGRLATIVAVCALAAGCPPGPHPASDLPPRVVRSIDAGVRAAQACEAEIDDDLRAYAACIDGRLQAIEGDPARRAGLRFQAWIMADLALQHSADGAAQARMRWWRGLQADLAVARLTIEDLCAHRGLSTADIRQRARRTIGAG